MSQPQIIVPDLKGINNSEYAQSMKRIEKAKTYKDLSTICIVPAIKAIPPKVVQSWRNMMCAMNQKFIMLMVENMEVGEAYSQTIEMILNHPDLSTWSFILTLETDNTPPPDGLLKLYEDIGEYDVVGGLYWTKGHGTSQPMAYGKTDTFPVNFIPFTPEPNTVTPVRGLGMGFTLFKMDVFKNKQLPKPLFETRQKYTPGVGSESFTQDLKFFDNAGRLGIRAAISSRVLVGHYDYQNDIMF